MELADPGPAVASSAENESIGIYADVSWTPRTLDAFTLNAGGRYSRDTRDAERVGSPAADTDYSRFDPSFTVDYRWTDELHTYARYATAYRAGGFNLLNSNLSPFEPEKLTSYELGLKATLLEGEMALNTVGFYSNYYDILRTRIEWDANGIHQQVTRNATRARIYGIESELLWKPAPDDVLQGVFTYLRAEYLDYPTVDSQYYVVSDPLTPVINLQGNQFWPLAGRIYELAKAQGVGREIPTEWFLQDIRD